MTWSRWTAALALHAVLAAVAGAYFAVQVGTAETRSVLSCLVMVELGLFAVAACLSAAAASPGRRRPLAWRLTGAGCAAWSLTQVHWTVLEITDLQPPALLGAVGLGYAALPLLALPALAMLALPRSRARRAPHERPLAVLDLVGLAGAVLAVGWVLALRHAVEHQHGWPSVFVLGDVLVAVAVLGLLTRHVGEVDRPLRLLGAGLVAVAATDARYLGLSLDGAYVTGTLLDTGWLVGFLLVAAAAVETREPRPARAPRRRRRLHVLLPFAPPATALGLLVLDAVGPGAWDPVVLALALTIVLLGSVRQGLTLLQNADLIDELAARQVDLRRQALHDPLTGLANRTLLLERLDAALADPAEPAVDLLFVDLDDFKLINDTHGHDAGDRVLVEVGRRLEALGTARDTVARLGGDEFAVLVVDRCGEAVAGEVLAALCSPVAVGARRFTVRASVGVVRAEADESAGTLLAHADIAMYTAKGSGKHRVAAVHGAERADAVRRTRVRELIAEPDLAHFSVLYQPVVDLRDGQLRGVEALVRWHHPEIGPVSPVEFVHLAEQAGTIGLLGQHVLVTALRDLARWEREAPERRLAVGVNVSPLQLTDDELLHAAVDELARHRLCPDQLVLEITEEALVGDIEVAGRTVAALRAAGMSVAIDDFGTGYSSFRYLDRFDADVLKIDRSFVATAASSARTRELVRSVADLGKALDLQTIGEGVETPAEMRLLREMGCELAQGYLFSRPVPAAQISALLAAGGVFPVAVPQPRPASV